MIQSRCGGNTLRVTAGENVGIGGTISPSSKLEVNGNVKLFGASDTKLFLTTGSIGSTEMPLAGGHIEIKDDAGIALHVFTQDGDIALQLS